MQFAYFLQPNIDWQKPPIQQAWQDYGRIIGRFLTTDFPYTASELYDYAQAYVRQHPDLLRQPVGYIYVVHCLLELSEANIVKLIRINHLLTRRNIDA